MWHYINNEDMTTWVKNTDKKLYWKLSAQCRARIPMLEDVYVKLKKQYSEK